MTDSPDLYWRHTWPEVGPDIVLMRKREGEHEIIGRAMEHLRSGHAEVHQGWTWSLTCCIARPSGLVKPVFATNGFEEGPQEARDALLSAWRREEAWRIEMRETVDLDGLSPYVRAYLMYGFPVPPKRVGG